MFAVPRTLLDVVTVLDIGCWCVCFWWMHRISTRQNAVLDQLQNQARRIEKISMEEHTILTELHPNVEDLQKGMDLVSESVARVEGTVENQQ